MDVEKYASSKLYIFFEWAYKLIIWNLLSLLIIAIFAGIPTIMFYSLQNEYKFKDIDIVNESIEVTLNNGQKNNIGIKIDSSIFKDYIVNENDYYLDENYIYMNLKYNDINYLVTINNKEEYESLDLVKFDASGDLVLNGNHKETIINDIFGGNISTELSKINGNNHVEIQLENGTKIDYGEVIETKHMLSGFLFMLAICLALFAFIPCFVTIFSVIKIYGESGSSRTFVLYFDRLWDNFKSLYKIEIVIVPLLMVMSYALYTYYMVITYSGSENYFYTISYNMILVCFILFLLWLISLPMTVGYFRMRPLTICKFTMIMAFRNILFTILYIVILLAPILLGIVNNFFLPIWFLVGFSLPLFLIYLISAKKYRYIVRNFDEIKNRSDDEYE